MEQEGEKYNVLGVSVCVLSCLYIVHGIYFSTRQQLLQLKVDYPDEIYKPRFDMLDSVLILTHYVFAAIDILLFITWFNALIYFVVINRLVKLETALYEKILKVLFYGFWFIGVMVSFQASILYSEVTVIRDWPGHCSNDWNCLYTRYSKIASIFIECMAIILVSVMFGTVFMFYL